MPSLTDLRTLLRDDRCTEVHVDIRPDRVRVHLVRHPYLLATGESLDAYGDVQAELEEAITRAVAKLGGGT